LADKNATSEKCPPLVKTRGKKETTTNGGRKKRKNLVFYQRTMGKCRTQIPFVEGRFRGSDGAVQLMKKKATEDCRAAATVKKAGSLPVGAKKLVIT